MPGLEEEGGGKEVLVKERLHGATRPLDPKSIYMYTQYLRHFTFL